MSADAQAQARSRDQAILDALDDEQRRVLDAEGAVRVGDALVWIEPEGGVRREPVSRLYYVRTPRGVFRFSKIDDALVEV
ncbi:MAG: hypothetical protein QNK03_07375 [Myxococcota bacterium]|nr:hypothetical protein [Myxococcota bacterium]